MGAVMVPVTALLKPGDTVVVPHDCYGGTWRLFTQLAEKGHFEVVTVDFTDPKALAEALARNPRVVWIETPSNPLLRITDIRAVAEAAHRSGAVVIARDAELHDLMTFWANVTGITGSPFDAYLTLRGLRTLAARLRVHQENAAAVVELLDRHPAVAAVHYPGLSSHPGHEVAKSQQDGFGAMVSFELAGGEAAVRALVEGLECFSLAESLGGVESLIAHPATMTHASMSEEARAAAGIGAGLLRLSLGIESAEDLIADLRAGLERAARVTG